MSRKVLITGGAGFIGSHLGDELVKHGHSVRALDNFTPRVHGSNGERPPGLNPDVEWIVGDVRDGAVVERALAGIDVVVHLAAAVGVGESLFESDRCISVNYVGTAVLVDCLRRQPPERLIVASSMSVYGEGLYQDAAGNLREVKRRTPEQLRRALWEPCPAGSSLTPVATPETKTPSAFTVYARSKFDQERVCWRFGHLTGVPTTMLRFFNIYGSRQSPGNPYTGDLSSFVSLLLRDRRPLLPEDGEQLRDFMHVHDAVAACRRAIEVPVAVRGVLNVGSGRARSLMEIARALEQATGKPDLFPQPSGRYNISDVRHCFADVERLEQKLGPRQEMGLAEGLHDLVRWVERTAAAPRARRTLEIGTAGQGLP
jgi:dTDP-L-rhamnose 4-epimerase